MKSIVLHHHLGLGDHFVCNGLVNHLCRFYDLIYLPCKEMNFITVDHLYADNSKVVVFSIKVRETDGTEKEHERVNEFSRIYNVPVYKLGFKNCNKKEFNTSFYRQLNLNFSMRYELFRLPSQIPFEEEIFKLFSKKQYCLVHREGSIGKFEISISTDLPIVEIEKDTNPYGSLLNYRKLIMNAAEIHCINSSIFHFVDSLDVRGRHVYHDVRKLDFKISDKWQVIEYD
ncbi:MAG: hypothetical protein FJX89_04955 [Bacteroidetes bacterium]|nr:hypothetical protein [Bacteroidota bacterium]